jgi:hypothetical protein
MNDRSLRPRDGVERSLDQFGARLRQDLDGDILGHEIALDQLAQEIDVRLRGCGKANFDLLEAELDQEIEHTALALGTHGLDEGLVAVAQIDAAPDRCSIDRTGWPSATG